jgi:hypothetical protein
MPLCLVRLIRLLKPDAFWATHCRHAFKLPSFDCPNCQKNYERRLAMDAEWRRQLSTRH